MNFFYSTLYDAVGIEENIVLYGPQNRNRSNFEMTDKKEQIRLFSDIVKAINYDKKSLNKISYHDPQGHRLGQLLTKAEILHLQDVAQLLYWVNWLGGVSVLMVIMLISLARWQRGNRPSFLLYHLAGLGGLLFSMGFVFLVGPEKFFYLMHTWVFPVGHQWFFYYQDSLMSTMMKAPDIFAYIAIELLLLGLIVYLFFVKLICIYIGVQK